jgi:16S rRNA (cytosine1402-N4)-methyltransferase
MRRGRKSGTDPDSSAARTRHIPVLLSEVLDALQPKASENYIDGTFGGGGYTRTILEAADCRVLAFDRDITAVRAAAPMCAEYPNRLNLINAPFSRMEEFARIEASADGMPPGDEPCIDGVVLDIGVSSMQLDQAERGFSFQNDGPLDMRMSAAVDPLDNRQLDVGESAADFINTADEEDIAKIIYQFGEERHSRAISRAIVAARAGGGIMRTRQLADIVLRVFHGRLEDGKHPATRTFQALRIFVNDELGELHRGLEAAERLLRPGGRLVVVTFHSLEDRIVKQFLAGRSGKTVNVSRHLPQQSVKLSPPSFRILNFRPLTPQKGELDVNPRARSARLRAAVRTEAVAWPAG